MSLILTQELKDLVNAALATGNPMLLAAVSDTGQPILSFRGSTQVYSDDQLGLWIRKIEGGTVAAIRHNPKVALMYRSATTPMLQFQGEARIATDAPERAKVFENSPEQERKSDPERKGLAIIIDINKVEGLLKFTAEGPVFVNLAR